MDYVKPAEGVLVQNGVVKETVSSTLEPQPQLSAEKGFLKNESLLQAGHWPTLLTAFLYFDFSFMAWTLLGALGPMIGESLHLSVEKKSLMVAVPILSGALLRIILGLAVDGFGAKATGITAQLVVIAALLCAWAAGLQNYQATLLLGAALGFAGASFAVALPQAGRWYPPRLQGVVMGLAGAGNIGTVLDALIAPRIAATYGWRVVFGLMLIPAVFVLLAYVLFSKEAPGEVKRKKTGRLLCIAQGTGRALVLFLLHRFLRRVRRAGQFLRALFQG